MKPAKPNGKVSVRETVYRLYKISYLYDNSTDEEIDLEDNQELLEKIYRQIERGELDRRYDLDVEDTKNASFVDDFNLEFLASLYEQVKHLKDYQKFEIDYAQDERGRYLWNRRVVGIRQETDEEYAERVKQYDEYLNKLVEKKQKKKELKAKKADVLSKLTPEEKRILGVK